MTAVPLLLDCDPGHDDVMAIVTAAAHGNLVGITTVAGNAALVHTTRNALVTCELAGIDVPVHTGAAGPLAGETRDATHVHGAEGLEGVEIPRAVPRTRGRRRGRASSSRPRVRRRACGSLRSGRSRTSRSRCERAPDIASAVAGISIMGGGTFGNATPAAEFNIWADPEAADVVFRSAARIRLCGLDLTHQVCADRYVHRRLARDRLPARRLRRRVARALCRSASAS